MLLRQARTPLRVLLALERSRRSLDGALAEVSAANSRTDHLAAELVARETFAHAVLDGLDLGVVTTDRAGIVSYVNRAARELLQTVTDGAGGDVRDLLGLPLAPDALLGAEPTKRLAFGLVMHDGTALDLELSVTRADGGSIEALGFFFVFRDVSEEKARTAERERFERLAAIGTMVAGFAHEVRNPVAALRSLAESVIEEAGDKAPPQLSRMLRMVERIERLVRTSLQFGRPAAPRRGRHRPWSIVAAALTEMLPRVKEAGDFRIEADPDLPDVYVDEGQVVQVLVILLSNALDAVGLARRVQVRVTRERVSTTKDGRLAVDAKKRDSQPPVVRDAVRFEIHDDGPGIPAELLSRIFDPFFTTKPSGTGLGLSIAQQIVSENGGALDVTSVRGATTFAVVVPAAT